MLHDDDTRLTFIDREIDQIPGGFVRLCTMTPDAVLTRGGLPQRERTLAFEANSRLQLAVHFDPQLFTPPAAWKANALDVTYEVCTKWCAHPFLLEDGTRRGPWQEDTKCRGAP